MPSVYISNKGIRVNQSHRISPRFLYQIVPNIQCIFPFPNISAHHHLQIPMRKDTFQHIEKKTFLLLRIKYNLHHCHHPLIRCPLLPSCRNAGKYHLKNKLGYSVDYQRTQQYSLLSFQTYTKSSIGIFP